MNDDAEFAARIAERYPEGLTGIFAIGGTRTAYLLERNRDRENPGLIVDMADYAQYTLDQYLRLMIDFFELGGKFLIIPPLSYQAFYERGDAYTQVVLDHTPDLFGETTIAVYRKYDADPYFVGIDTLLQLPETEPIRALGVQLREFQQSWPYRPGRRKVIWEIAPIPLFSFWQAPQTMPQDATAAMEAGLRAATDLREMYDILFAYYARAALGTQIPVPHFYIGTNRNGDLKLRSMIPLAMLAGGPFRMFFLPYPFPLVTRQVLRAIFEDLAFASPSLSKNYDYSGRYTAQLAQAEYQRMVDLASDVQSVVGLKRKLGL